MNTTITKSRSLIVAIITFGSLVGGANAAVMISYSDTINGVKIDVSGTLNTSGLTFIPFNETTAHPGFVHMANQDTLFIAEDYSVSGGYQFAAHGQTVPTWHALDQNSVPSMVLGSSFGINHVNVTVPLGYVSGTPLDTSVVLTNETVASLNPSNGLILTLANGDTITSVVPEPSSSILIGLGFMSLTCRRSRR